MPRDLCNAMRSRERLGGWTPGRIEENYWNALDGKAKQTCLADPLLYNKMLPCVLANAGCMSFLSGGAVFRIDKYTHLECAKMHIHVLRKGGAPGEAFGTVLAQLRGGFRFVLL